MASKSKAGNEKVPSDTTKKSNLFGSNVPAEEFKYPVPSVKLWLEEMQEVFRPATNLSDELSQVEALEPPTFVKNIMASNGKLGLDFDDPEVQQILERAQKR